MSAGGRVQLTVILNNYQLNIVGPHGITSGRQCQLQINTTTKRRRNLNSLCLGIKFRDQMNFPTRNSTAVCIITTTTTSNTTRRFGDQRKVGKLWGTSASWFSVLVRLLWAVNSIINLSVSPQLKHVPLIRSPPELRPSCYGSGKYKSDHAPPNMSIKGKMARH